MEPEDRLALDNPYEYAIEPGGEIFFILLDELVGWLCSHGAKAGAGATVAEFELAKMAVRPDIQGQGLGQQLLERCIQYAKEQGAPAESCLRLTIS